MQCTVEGSYTSQGRKHQKIHRQVSVYRKLLIASHGRDLINVPFSFVISYYTLPFYVGDTITYKMSLKTVATTVWGISLNMEKSSIKLRRKI